MVAIHSMDGFDTQFGKHDAELQIDLRQRVAARLLEQANIITGDSAAIFPQSGGDDLDIDDCRRVGQLLTQLLALAVRDGRVDTRGGFVGDLCSIVLERSLPADRVFTFTYFTERTATDELALSDSFGATTEAWPIVAQMIRRASFDVLAAYTERAHIEPAGNAVIDRLTTLYSRAMFDAVLAKEVDRAGRFGQPFSIILFDVDRLSDINQEYGYGVGDKVLERLGILMRTYFRQHDWVARHSEDSMAVLLTHTGADRAIELAERVRHTVESRLWFTDHRTERQVPVTVSAAVVNVPVSSGDVVDPERLIALGETAIDRAKRQGRNRVETVDGSPGIQVRLPSY